jgi:DNA/RNA-binding domain of Phe-tRNA-synthetase-like protein
MPACAELAVHGNCCPLAYNNPMLTVNPHPLLDLRAFRTHFPQPLAELLSPAVIQALFSLQATAPLVSDDHVRQVVRDLLRAGGFKPTGRSKPASEYLLKAAQEGRLTGINLAVDVCNAVSLHSGLPITVIDLDQARPPLRVAVAPAGSNYVFNASGQTIDLDGLLCLMDADGPCGNAVKDAQRTKTSAPTQNTLTLIWGSTALPGRAAAAEAWYRQLLHQHGAATANVGYDSDRDRANVSRSES